MIHLAVVVCDRKSRLEQAMVMLKSAVLFSHSDLMFHIFADSDLQMEFEIKVSLVSILNVQRVAPSLATLINYN